MGTNNTTPLIDTNAMVSGMLNPHGPPGRIVSALLSETVNILHDDRILSEYSEVLLRPTFGFARSDVAGFLDFVESADEHVKSEVLPLVLPDPDDLHLLEAAASGAADALITGDIRHFKPRRGRHSVLVTTPSDFLRHQAD
jgi:putative PIN family toxin of toxin-antitoxin system